MKRLVRRASLVVVLLLLASIGTASAECAWVLWQRDITENPDGVWVPREGFKNVAECKALESKADHRYNPQTRTMEPIPGGHTICLPDTIDPRGPKAR